MKKAVVFGAGNIGRGFLGQIFFEAGYEITFIEAMPAVVTNLNQKKAYPLWVVSEKGTEKFEISRVQAVPAEDKEAAARTLKDADISATAVGVNNLPRIYPLIACGIEKRFRSKTEAPLNIIICENLLSAGKVFRTEIKKSLSPEFHPYFDEKVGLVETVVSRMVPPVPIELKEKEPLLVLVEPYKILPVARTGFKGELPEISGFHPVENISAYEEQKLYIHNLGHAVCAYLGYLKGYRYIWEAVADSEISHRLTGCLNETGTALVKKHPFLQPELPDHITDLRHRFANKALGDTVWRVGREPLRKLGPSDRLVGALRLCRDYGVEPENLIFTIASALCYNYKEDEEAAILAKMISENGPGYVLQEVCKIKPEEPIYNAIIEKYNKLSKQC